MACLLYSGCSLGKLAVNLVNCDLQNTTNATLHGMTNRARSLHVQATDDVFDVNDPNIKQVLYSLISISTSYCYINSSMDVIGYYLYDTTVSRQ
jgi:hypothetical protein